MTPRKGLRTGFSTGTAAAAATKGALLELLGMPCPDAIDVTLPGGRTLAVPIHSRRMRGDIGECTVVKDGGDDPDVTHGAEIGVRVRPVSGDAENRIRFVAGEGVGTVTKPGLPIPPGEPAINPVPRKMIALAVSEVLEEWGRVRHVPEGPFSCIEVEVFVPEGGRLAKETLNPRLGIVGGISILGTTGIVKPFSHGAYRATIHSALRVARASVSSHVVLTTGSSSDARARELFPELPFTAFVEMGDFIKFAVEQAVRLGFGRLTVVCFAGKALKIAQGLANTHASEGAPDLALLARWVHEVTGNEALARSVGEAVTARGAITLLKQEGRETEPIVERLGSRSLSALRNFAGQEPALDLVILDHENGVLWQSGFCL